MKFTIKIKEGGTIEVKQLATFTHQIKHRRFRFVVTAHNNEITLSHRISTMKVCTITYTTIASAKGDYINAGRISLDRLIEKTGIDRVYDALNNAEKEQ